MLVEGVANVLLFVPLGALLAAAVPRVGALRLWLLCVAASVAAELVQAAVLTDRHPSARDIALNGLGAGIGVALGRRFLAGYASAPAPRAPASSP